MAEPLIPLDQVRALALALPESEESVSHGQPTFFVAGKMFAQFRHDHHGDGRTIVAVKTGEAEETRMLIEADTRRDLNQRLQQFLDTSSWQRTTLHHSMTVDFATLLGYAESLSAIPRPRERGYEGMVAELRAVFTEYQRDGALVTPLACELFLGRLRNFANLAK